MYALNNGPRTWYIAAAQHQDALFLLLGCVVRFCSLVDTGDDVTEFLNIHSVVVADRRWIDLLCTIDGDLNIELYWQFISINILCIYYYQIKYGGKVGALVLHRVHRRCSRSVLHLLILLRRRRHNRLSYRRRLHWHGNCGLNFTGNCLRVVGN